MCILYYYVADNDYDSGPVEVTFNMGDTSAEVSINITEDFIDEEDEAFRLVLKRTNDTSDLVEIGNPMNATGIIDNDDELGMSDLCDDVYIQCTRHYNSVYGMDA